MNGSSEVNVLDNLNYDEDDENEKLKLFYEKNLQFLRNFPDKRILADISVMIHKTFLNNVEWREYAEGIADNDDLDKVEARAALIHEQELFLFLTTIFQKTKRFDDLIHLLIEKKQFGVLLKIRPVAERLIEKSCNPEVKGYHMIEPNYSSEQMSNTSCSIQDITSETSIGNTISYKNKTCMQNHPSYMNGFNDLQQSSVNDSSTTEILIPDSIVFDKSLIQNSLPEREPVPSAPVQKKSEEISVFIPHTKSDINYAVQLSNKLKTERFKVKTMSDMDVILAINQTEALGTIIQEVDFYVPVISDSFLKQIHATDLKQFSDIDDVVNNRYFYHLIMDEYKNNNCYNLKVRPIIVPGMTKEKLKSDIVLSFPFRFGKEEDKLIKNLKETKDLIPQYRLWINNG